MRSPSLKPPLRSADDTTHGWQQQCCTQQFNPLSRTAQHSNRPVSQDIVFVDIVKRFFSEFGASPETSFFLHPVPNRSTSEMSSVPRASMTTKDILQRIRSLPLHSRVTIIIALCKKFQSVPDSRLPKGMRNMFDILKKLVTTHLVCVNPIMKNEYKTSKDVVLLIHQPPPSSLPTNGTWVALGTHGAEHFTSNLQTYIFVSAGRIYLSHARRNMKLPKSTNVSIDKTDAQMLLHFANHAE